MSDKLEILEAVDNSSPALANHAIARCAKAWEKAYRAQLEHGGFETDAAKKAAEAYRAALPPLTNRDNCRDFVACVAHGMLLGAISENNAGKLLYAAQVAIIANSAEEKSRERAGYAAYLDLTEAEAACARKCIPLRSKAS